METLTWREARAFDYIRRYIAGHGYAPSVRDIGAAIGMSSKSGVYDVLSRLEAKGYVRRERGLRGTLAVTRREEGMW